MELDTLLDEARDLFDETVALRRTLHRWPELGNDLPVTREHVLGALEGLLQLTLHETTSGIAAVLDGGKPGPTVLLRGDMDALPLHEDTDLEFESADEGKMHAQWPRHAHGDAGRRGEVAQRPSRPDPRPGAVHVPAW